MPAPFPAPNFDPGAAYPEVDPMRAAMTAGDWPTVRRIFDGQDWAGRDLLVQIIGELRGIEPFLRAMQAEHSDDTLPGTLLGAHLIDVGWEIRTSARATHVSREQFEALHRYLRQAEQLLIDATARDPGNVTAWTSRLTTARGLQLGQAEARRRYDRLAGYHPHHLPAQSSLLQQFCPKWSGSWEKMFAFARECAAAAPPGAPNAVLVAEAHLERWLDLDTKAEQTAYLRDPQVHREIWEAAQRSVLHPQFQHRHGWVWVRGTFALWLCMIDQHAAAATQFAALGPLASGYPWSYFGNEAEQFEKFRAEAYAKGGAR